ncbi:sensor histidine kinase [Halobacteriales archaeon QS_1_67_19]|nr:MAG: sensor histidine kinase [Halobacteriales archaeon QS_1_67_19]
MRRWTEGRPSINGARVIAALGSLYVVLAAARTYSVVSAGARVPGQVLNFLLVAVPGLLLAYCGYWLTSTDLPSEAYARMAGWSFLGGGVVIAVILVVELTPSSGIENPVLAVLLFGVLGSAAGFGIGLQEARAVTQARAAEQQHRAVERYSDELERQNERLESFAGMLAHELRNPLNIAQLYLQQLEGDREAVEETETALARMEEMIDILLVTVRGSEADIDWKPVSLSSVARDAWSDLSTDRAELRVETDQTVRADAVHVRHLLENLFRNALEHGGDDVTVRVGPLDGSEGFYVADDGPGIPSDIREEVTQAGYTTKSDGIGLGLTFVANLVDAYGWEWAITESEAGGARFEFSGIDTVAATEAEPR